MIAPLALLAASLAFSQSDAPVGSPGVSQLRERFIGTIDEPERVKIVEQIALTTPVSAQDVSALFDLFSRFPDPGLRRKVMESLARIPANTPQLEPLFVTYLQQPEPESQLFGINGAFRLRSRSALPLIRKIAERKIFAAKAESVTMMSERNEWWTQYEALSALAQWEGGASLTLLNAKALESPAVARLLGQFFWLQTFPSLKKWAASADAGDRDRAVEAAGAPIEESAARATREGMLEILRDPKADDEVRHRLALKIGAVATDDEAAALLQEHDKAADDKSRLLWAAAAFASRNPKVAPLLARYATKSADEAMRAGARAQLVDMVGEDGTKILLEEKPVAK